MQASDIPSLLQKAFAASGTKNTIPVASQIGVTPGAASLTDGFPPLTMTPLAAGGVPPYGADMNGILNWLSAIGQWSNAGGMYHYDSSFSTAIGGYQRGAQILAADFSGIWVSTADNNTTDPDTGGANWVKNLFGGYAPIKTFAQIIALTSDQGPIQCSDMGGKLYTWQTSAYFTGYRSVCTGEIPNTFLATPTAWMQSMIGGTWSTSDPKQARLIAWFQEQGLTIAQASWTPGMGMIASLGSGNWQAPDARNMFWRVEGTDADTSNAAPAGTYKADTFASHYHNSWSGNAYGQVTTGSGGGLAFLAAGGTSNQVTGSTGKAETAPKHTRVAPVILI